LLIFAVLLGHSFRASPASPFLSAGPCHPPRFTSNSSGTFRLSGLALLLVFWRSRVFPEVVKAMVYPPRDRILVRGGRDQHLPWRSMSEVIRSGIQAIPKTQLEAGLSTGLSMIETYRLILIPVALRLIVPPATNESLNLLKNTSFGDDIGIAELTSPQGRSKRIRQGRGGPSLQQP